ncbi:GrpB family protein [Candidatus Cloacimonadota bacterium]
MKIEVIDYDSNWIVQFQKLKKKFINHLSPFILSIEHVGSTSVPGLSAKSVLDIDIIIEDNAETERKVIKKLAEIGYRYLGDLGISGREAFTRRDDYTPKDGSGRTWQKHNLYLCRLDSLGLRNHLAFRNFLRENPDQSRVYGELKKNLANKFSHDIDAYIDGKTDFIVNILKLAGISEQDRKMISTENKLK